ncbi:uncharacterized protein SPPG_06507 [Spizellomyces punctatus DAOM BR117]|uniref:Pirin N-terminal domain-containing protein n=1 Tax=Spizellomyces punctatus (strain DAOM BR117) TaxID=645134 RepID=A0A0L0HBK5_SPIPD|nr:uncharacterized protein SPPG_06507 [Spizellomyces punctatus DAOM BR117]KNC98098.1 hypothetical protein SPPG_06507 [Spizellomyces punctatus DAOM BR117]|eukprot:XP_016606138.1 hypothetical protein SPPG_06507 [Spizellomyces punctatus DAOM BR117]
MPTFQIRKSAERGHANHGWLDTYHTFSFANYHDTKFMGFGALRVLNEDRVASENGFGTHPHKEYEIFSYIVSGVLTHTDSLGHIERLTRGMIQHTSAGTGVAHSETNNDSETVHFLQIWLKPAVHGLNPSYVTRTFTDSEKRNRLCPVLKPDPSLGLSVPVELQLDSLVPTHADVYMFAGILDKGHKVVYRPVGNSRRMYVHVVMGGGSLRVGEVVLFGGDGVFIEGVDGGVEVEGVNGSVEFVVLDLD